jgi:hypothetical protein
MSMIPSHTHDAICPLCQLKLKQAHPYLQKWFLKIKSRHFDAHISWSYRDQADQEKAFSEGKTHAHYPNSPHNHLDQDGNPLSLALDLFQLSEQGKALWEQAFFRMIWDECVKDGDDMIWGGNFRSLGDLDHFQFNPNAKT